MKTLLALCTLFAYTTAFRKNCDIPTYQCPDTDVLKPCTCAYLFINCSGVQSDEQLQRALTAEPSETTLTEFLMEGTPVAHLPTTLFDTISFFSIIIRHNRIRDLIQGVFSASSSLLRNLDLSYNRLEDFPSSALLDLKYLAFLDLSGNQIKVIPSNAVEQIISLQTLRLRKNKIHSVHSMAFSHPGVIKEVDLSYNSLRKIERDMLKTYNGFNIIDLDRNLIDSAASDAFDDIVNFSGLYLRRNRLSTLRRVPFEKLFRMLEGNEKMDVFLNGNDIKCDSTTKWLLGISRGARRRIHGITCKGRHLEDLTIYDFVPY